jgi:hypothetical protein
MTRWGRFLMDILLKPLPVSQTQACTSCRCPGKSSSPWSCSASCSCSCNDGHLNAPPLPEPSNGPYIIVKRG